MPSCRELWKVRGWRRSFKTAQSPRPWTTTRWKSFILATYRSAGWSRPTTWPTWSCFSALKKVATFQANLWASAGIWNPCPRPRLSPPKTQFITLETHAMPRMTGAQFIAKSLKSYGVSHVFFVPAIMSHTLAQLDLCTDVKRIMTHGEKSAVYMADGYARASGRVGVSFAQCIGAANLAAGLRDAYLACTPLVVFTGGPYSQSRGRHFYQEINDLPLFAP